MSNLIGISDGCPCDEFNCMETRGDLHLLMISQAANPHPDEIRLSLLYNHSFEEEHYVDFEKDDMFEQNQMVSHYESWKAGNEL